MKNVICFALLSMLSAPIMHAAAHFDSEDEPVLPPLFGDAMLLPIAEEQTLSSLQDMHLLPILENKPQAVVLTGYSEKSPSSREEPSVSLRIKRQRSISSSPSTKAEWICPLCNHIFACKGVLKRHIKNVHKGKRHQCPSCEKSFRDESSLSKHIKNVHQGKRHQCPSCEQTFAYKSNLYRHIKRHEDITYACKVCNKDFTQKFSLKQHMKSVHEGTTYQCLSCQKFFTFKNNVQKHMRKKHPEVDSSQKRQRGST